jgi:NAD(P)-dependent dehydrogenase (short-subunit alcohol dehydrogenase family)
MEGRLAVVTGGTRGIGRGIVDRFVAEGAHVVVSARSQGSGRDLVATHADNVTFVVADAARLVDLDRLADAVAAQGRPLDTIIANAGGGPRTALATVTEELYDEVMDVNVKSALFTVQKLLGSLRDGGTVVLIGSIAGSNGDTNAIAYCAAKAAVRSLARTMTAELRDRRIRVNCLSPGPTESHGFGAYIGSDPAVRQGIVDRLPVGHIGAVEEQAAAALFLATEASSYIAGAELVVDGGFSQI